MNESCAEWTSIPMNESIASNKWNSNEHNDD